MAKVRAPTASLSRMLEPASDDDLTQSDNDLMLTPDSAIENRVAPKKKSNAKAASKASKVTKARAPARRDSGGTTKKAAPKKAASSRKALSEKPNSKPIEQDESEVEEVEEFDESMEVVEEVQPAPVEKKKKAKNHDQQREPKKKSHKKQQQQQYVEDDEEDNYARKNDSRKQSRVPPRIPASRAKPKAISRAPSKERNHVIPETQPDPMEIEPSSTTIEGEESSLQPLPSKPASAAKQSSSAKPALRARSESRQRRPERVRSASVSDREGRTTDPALRRKLGDTTKKLESLEIKYRNLQEIGTRTAESNFEKLKRASDERAKRKS
jgi:hypothetical protein